MYDLRHSSNSYQDEEHDYWMMDVKESALLNVLFLPFNSYPVLLPTLMSRPLK